MGYHLRESVRRSTQAEAMNLSEESLRVRYEKESGVHFNIVLMAIASLSCAQSSDKTAAKLSAVVRWRAGRNHLRIRVIGETLKCPLSLDLQGKRLIVLKLFPSD